jgi:hypothetical protein
MIGNFRLANKFATVNSKYVYENVYFDRFNSIFKGFYLVVGKQQLDEMIQNNQVITFTKIPSTERFGSQDITQLEFFDPTLVTPDEKKIIHMLNALINTGTGYGTVTEI